MATLLDVAKSFVTPARRGELDALEQRLRHDDETESATRRRLREELKSALHTRLVGREVEDLARALLVMQTARSEGELFVAERLGQLLGAAAAREVGDATSRLMAIKSRKATQVQKRSLAAAPDVGPVMPLIELALGSDRNHEAKLLGALLGATDFASLEPWPLSNTLSALAGYLARATPSSRDALAQMLALPRP